VYIADENLNDIGEAALAYRSRGNVFARSCATCDRAGAGNGAMDGLRHQHNGESRWSTATPSPVATAPALDPTGLDHSVLAEDVGVAVGLPTILHHGAGNYQMTTGCCSSTISKQVALGCDHLIMLYQN
jgi:hypothetical protein